MQSTSPPGFPPVESYKTCLACGMKVAVQYSVCPFCREDTSGKKKKISPALGYASGLSVLVGLGWLVIGIYTTAMAMSYFYYPYYKPPYNPYYILLGGLLCDGAGVHSIFAGIFVSRRDRPWSIVLSLGALICGPAGTIVTLVPGTAILSQAAIVNLIVLLVALAFKDDFNSDTKAGDRK